MKSIAEILKYNKGVLETKMPAEILRDYHRAYPLSEQLAKEFLERDLIKPAIDAVETQVKKHTAYVQFLKLFLKELKSRIK